MTERVEVPAVVADDERAPGAGDAGGDLAVQADAPCGASGASVEREDVTVPRADDHEAADDERRRLARRSERPLPEEPSVVGAERAQLSRERREVEATAPERRGGGHALVQVATPDPGSVLRSERGERPVSVADVADAVARDRRELEQLPEGQAPDGAERGAQGDAGRRVAAFDRRAVDRPRPGCLPQVDARERPITPERHVITQDRVAGARTVTR